MRSTTAWKIVDTRIVVPKMATHLSHLRRGSGLPSRQRAMLFMIKDLITQKGQDGVPLARNYSRKSLAKMHHYRRSFYFMTIIFYQNHIIIILFAKSCSRAKNFSGYSPRIPSFWNVTFRRNSLRSIYKTENQSFTMPADWLSLRRSSRFRSSLPCRSLSYSEPRLMRLRKSTRSCIPKEFSATKKSCSPCLRTQSWKS